MTHIRFFMDFSQIYLDFMFLELILDLIKFYNWRLTLPSVEPS